MSEATPGRAAGTSRSRRGGATIEQVARAAGVSRQTVSNTLNFPERVRPDTLARVHAAIEELGYRPDESARALRTGERRTFAYLAPVDDPHDPNPLMGGFLEALVDAAGAEGYRVLLFRPPPGTTDPRSAVDDLIAARQVDGFVIADVLADDVRVRHLAQAGVPFVSFGRTGADEPQNWVDIDNAAAMGTVAAHLAERGHRRVGYLGPAETGPTAGTPATARTAPAEGAAELPWLTARRRGLSDAATALGLELTTALATVAPVDAARALLSGRRRATALVAASDLLALAAYEAVWAEGLTVGRDVAVVGFHDLPFGRVLQPPLSSVRLPLRGIASALVRGLLAQVRGGEPSGGVLLPAELLIRASSGG
ncbi:LacI family DNA-binding transcriptional regulator [Streptacidiphilus rugosus]|uniref:LacI family DNA-binding transcriptional regulator n=1 Tax=Streptacidiphilus rugosus TaxID=405783 RepID=UPI00056482E6|nr:LacI family DNA-binding transcriptional regulator [Streptacidiphilus rugosus]